jgi:hypothetical protein
MTNEIFPKGIPYKSLAAGIQHGPYADIPEQLLEHYLASREQMGVSTNLPDEQLRADTQSEWQYDQHSAAVMDALEADRISAEHAMYMLERVLRPWFVGRRTGKDLDQTSS